MTSEPPRVHVPDTISHLLDTLSHAIDTIAEVDLTTLPAPVAGEVVRNFEVQLRRLDAVAVDHVGQIELAGHHHHDGHRTPATMVRHLGRLDRRDAAERARIARALTHLDEFRAAYHDGRIGRAQAARIALAWSNPRIRDGLRTHQSHLLRTAVDDPHDIFDDLVKGTIARLDPDGPTPRHHRTRRASLHANPDGSWELRGTFPAETGVRMAAVLDRYTDAEWHTDHDDTRARLGDHATPNDYPRTTPQRRADALAAIFERAATTPPGGEGTAITVDLTIDYELFQRELARLADPTHDARQPGDPTDLWAPSHTLDGTPLHPATVCALSLQAHVRRVVLDSASVPIDMGRRTRLFRGTARDAVLHRHTHCCWAGCPLPNSLCQGDHLIPYSGPDQGPTTPANGAPLCGHHNRHKQRGYEVWQDPDGRWRTIRPDGTEV